MSEKPGVATSNPGDTIEIENSGLTNAAEAENVREFKRETTMVGDKLYDADILKSYAEEIETQEVDLETLRKNVGEGHYFWIDKNGDKLGPAQVLKDWEAAEHNSAWIDHIETIKRANLDRPIWVTKDGFVFNGMHRLTRAFIDGVSKVKVKVFEEMPESAVIKKDEDK